MISIELHRWLSLPNPEGAFGLMTDYWRLTNGTDRLRRTEDGWWQMRPPSLGTRYSSLFAGGPVPSGVEGMPSTRQLRQAKPISGRRQAKQSQFVGAEMMVNYSLKRRLWPEGVDSGPMKTKPIKANFRPGPECQVGRLKCQEQRLKRRIPLLHTSNFALGGATVQNKANFRPGAGVSSRKFQVSSAMSLAASPPTSHFQLHTWRESLRDAVGSEQTKPNVGKMGHFGGTAWFLEGVVAGGWAADRVGGSFGFTGGAGALESNISTESELIWHGTRAAGSKNDQNRSL